jgi:hypothetical protein
VPTRQPARTERRRCALAAEAQLTQCDCRLAPEGRSGTRLVVSKNTSQNNPCTSMTAQTTTKNAPTSTKRPEGGRGSHATALPRAACSPVSFDHAGRA